MHTEALVYLAHATANLRPMSILELGSRDINGSPRTLFPGVRYVGVDIEDGPGVDIVADASTWIPDRHYDLAIAMEIFEHTEVWPEIVGTAYESLHDGGAFIVTAAGPNRAPHSAVDGGALRPGEYYANVDPTDLRYYMVAAGFEVLGVEWARKVGDVYATGVRCVS